MFLKSLTLKGFKSFAEPAVLEFEPGVTVVVGPNGSGKSNVVDAVAWVLGAQGPRTLRSAKMEDVIFAGSAQRPALGRAEVSLTIDNSAGKLATDLVELTITRTLFRSGDSEYAINGAPCRLLDIQELLSDTGVGRQQHVIISQGHLDAILEARPEDRRAVIEEAAGVLKHRRRRERAERRLAATEENLERLFDLVREVKRQIRPLERQAAAARSYAGLADELRAVRLFVAGYELRSLDERRTEGERLQAELRVAEDDLGTKLAQLDADSARTADELSAERESDLAASLARAEGMVERARGLAGVLRERQRSLARALDAAADADVVSTLEAEGARLGEELALADREEQELAPEQDGLAVRRSHAQRRAPRPISPRGATVASSAARTKSWRSLVRSSRRSNTRSSVTGATSTSSPAGWPRQSGAPRHSRAKSTSSPSGWPSTNRNGIARRPRWPTPRPRIVPEWRPSSAPRRPCAKPSRTTPVRSRGPTPSNVPSTRRVAVHPPSCSPASTEWSAPCSTWWTSTPDGKRPSRPQPVPRSPRSSSPAASLLVPPSPVFAGTARPGRCSRSPVGADRAAPAGRPATGSRADPHPRAPRPAERRRRSRRGARHAARTSVLCRARMVGGDRRGTRSARPGGGDPRGRSLLVDRMAGPRGRRAS